MSEKHKVDGMLIGEYVQNTIRNLFDEKKIFESDLINLQRQEYCKGTFHFQH